MEIPALVFDKIWRSKYATNKYIKKIFSGKVNFSGKSVLDFGCGTGSYAFLFDPEKYIGIDLMGKRIEYAKKHHPKYKFKKIDIKQLASEENNFDYIFIISTLHHIDDETLKKYFKLFFRILNKKGAIVGMEPCLLKNTPFKNWFMKTVDRGKFIRSEKEYKTLFGDMFLFDSQKKFTRHGLYNELFYIAYKKQNYE